MAEAGDELADAGDYAEAIGLYEDALRRGESTPHVHHNLGRALFEMGDISTAVGHFERAAAASDQVGPRLALATIIPGDPAASNARILQVRRAFATRLAEAAASRPAARQRPPESRDGRPPEFCDSRIRVGFLSSWFDRGHYMKPVWSLLEHLDRASFEVHLFSDTLPADMPGFEAEPGDRTHWTGWLDNEQLAGVIRSSGIQILVDLNGYSAPHRLPLFLESPAPVTVGWFNLYATSGLPGIPYVIGDRVVVTPDEKRHYSERVLRLPVCWVAFEVQDAAPPVAPPPCLGAGFLTFGSLAPQYKLTPPVLDSWSGILRRAPRTRLLIANSTLGTPGNRAYVAGRLAERGVAEERLTLLGPAEHAAFVQYYDRIDVVLDTFPYGGSTTVMEALWQGAPVLTAHGDRWASRTASTLLRHAGLDHFVARDTAELEAFAVRFACDPASPGRLAEWRSGQRRRLRASRICDGAPLARHMGRLYKALLRLSRRDA